MKKQLEVLKQVKPGEKTRDVITAARINAMQDLIKALFFGENLKGAGGITIQKQDSGVSIVLSYLDPAVLAASGITPGGSGNPPDPNDPPSQMPFRKDDGTLLQLGIVELTLCDGRTLRVLGSIA
jgi:hypothetical protein